MALCGGGFFFLLLLLLPPPPAAAADAAADVAVDGASFLPEPLPEPGTDPPLAGAGGFTLSEEMPIPSIPFRRASAPPDMFLLRKMGVYTATAR